MSSDQKMTFENISQRVMIRPFRNSDSVDDITALLHRSYRQLADMGLRYLATHQDAAITRQRLTGGRTLIAELDRRIIGTITCYDSEKTSGSPYLDREGVGHLGQFGIDPPWQRLGIGTRMFHAAEEVARQMGLAAVALDTAEPAEHLIRWYLRLGYRVIEHVRWDITNYRSVVLGKDLT